MCVWCVYVGERERVRARGARTSRARKARKLARTYLHVSTKSVQVLSVLNRDSVRGSGEQGKPPSLRPHRIA